MNKLKIAIVGYGNIGQYAAQGVLSAPDMELCGIVRREAVPIPELPSIPVVEDPESLGQVDAAILCCPSRKVEEYALHYLSKGIRTVDGFDVHGDIWDLRCKLDDAAKKTGAASILAAGWDPGSDSVVRALLEACAPQGLTYTNFGPGMSMGHTVAVKAIEGVANALSVTIPTGAGVHRRMVYVELKPGHALETVAAAIKADPYFVQDDTHVREVPSVSDILDRGHGVHMTRKGIASGVDNQNFSYSMTIHNPALTAQVLVSCARAVMRQIPGAYTMVELPLVHLLPGTTQEIVRRLV